MTQTRPIQRTPALHLIAAACLGGLAVVWLVVAVWISQLREFGRETAEREMASLATLLVDHTERTLQGVDLLLSLLSSRLEPLLAAGGMPDPQALHAILQRELAGLPQVHRAFILGPDGKTFADSQFLQPRPIDASDRPHFHLHRDDPGTGIYVSEPIQSRVDGEWSIILSRRLNRPDGGFAGIIAATLRPAYFGEIFRASLNVPDTKVILWRNGAVVMASAAPDEQPVVGTRMPIPWSYAPERTGVLRGHSPVFGIDRLSAYARAASYPVLVVVTRSIASIAASSTRSERMIVVAGALVSLLVVALGWLLARQMRSLEGRFRDGIEHMSDGFALWDADHRLIAWNSRFESLLPGTVPFLRPGVGPEELIRSTLAATRHDLSADEREAVVRERMALIATGKQWELPTIHGLIVEVEQSATSAGGTVTIIRDMTERKQREDALERALTVEREANELHRRFVTMASHEFRTPLAVIDGAAQRLRGRAPTEDSDGAGKLDRIRSAVAAMTMLIDRTLSSARLEAGSIAVDRQTIDLGELLREACARQLQISPGFEIVTSIPSGPLPLEADARLLDQVFGNLLSNAVKYSGKARRIDVAIERVAEPESAISVRVNDHGIGIPAAEIGRLFTRFFRASTAQGIAGTGIGLHLTRELVRLHGGRIDVTSRVGGGTSFVVVLPQRLAGVDAHAA